MGNLLDDVDVVLNLIVLLDLLVHVGYGQRSTVVSSRLIFTYSLVLFPARSFISRHQGTSGARP